LVRIFLILFAYIYKIKKNYLIKRETKSKNVSLIINKGNHGIDWQSSFFEMQAELVLETLK
jgi:hypothetical protein